MKKQNLILRMLTAALGLVVFAFGAHLTIKASIGIAPWDVFSMGASYHLPLSYGDIVMLLGAVIIIIDLLLKEKIGVGTILDALIVGKSTDLFLNLDIVPYQENLWLGILYLIAGLLVMAFGQWLYMKVGLGCGPRDSLLVAVGKRLRKLPIGLVNILIQAVVFLIGWALGGPIGIGTAISVFGIGLAMQLVFRIVKFEPRDVTHESIITTYKNVRCRIKQKS